MLPPEDDAVRSGSTLCITSPTSRFYPGMHGFGSTSLWRVRLFQLGFMCWQWSLHGTMPPKDSLSHGATHTGGQVSALIGWLIRSSGCKRRSLDDLDEGEGAGEPCLLVQPWWANHLQESGAGDPDGPPPALFPPTPSHWQSLQQHCGRGSWLRCLGFDAF